MQAEEWKKELNGKLINWPWILIPVDFESSSQHFPNYRCRSSAINDLEHNNWNIKWKRNRQYNKVTSMICHFQFLFLLRISIIFVDLTIFVWCALSAPLVSLMFRILITFDIALSWNVCEHIIFVVLSTEWWLTSPPLNRKTIVNGLSSQLLSLHFSYVQTNRICSSTEWNTKKMVSSLASSLK